jgi:Ca-activated chloride channel family protein
VSFSSDAVRMDRDFILNLEHEEGGLSRAFRFQGEEEAFLQLDLYLSGGESPNDRKAHEAREIIFLLDCSGSMQGDSIREARKALEICLRGMEEGSFFNVYRFGSTHQALFPEAVPYRENEINKALKLMSTVNADLGGTEILRPLREIYSSVRETDRKRVVILLTDGEVGNESEVFDLVRKGAGATRMFAIGIGAGCNEYFIKGLARAGKGASEFIYPGERIEPKVLRIFGRLSRGVLENPEIQWGEGRLEQAPASPAIFLESPVTIFAKGNAGVFSQDWVTVNGKVDGRERTWQVEVLEANHENLPLPLLWAREKIRDLEESGDERGSRQADRKKSKQQQAIVEISKRYGVLSQSTSYVAVEQREEKDKTTGEVVLRRVPALVTVGWHGMGACSGLQAVCNRICWQWLLLWPI